MSDNWVILLLALSVCVLHVDGCMMDIKTDRMEADIVELQEIHDIKKGE